jgi:hypothetical protein
LSETRSLEDDGRRVDRSWRFRVLIFLLCHHQLLQVLKLLSTHVPQLRLQLRVRFVPAALLAMLRTALALQCVSKSQTGKEI